jgi:hypothetical protein
MPATIPVVAELWKMFETTLQSKARALVEDIAKHNKGESADLWKKVKAQIKIGLIDIEVPDSLPTTCKYPESSCEMGAVFTRCRAPCSIGFDACQRHINLPIPSITKHELVNRVMDCNGRAYFVDTKNIARDKNGKPKGYVEDSVLFLFETEKEEA